MKNRKKATLLERAARVFRALSRVRNVDDIEKTLIALGLAASPEERWEINHLFVNRLPPSARQAMMAEFLQTAEAQFKK